MRTLGWVGLCLVLGVASLAFVPKHVSETAQTCARDFSAGFLDNQSPDLVRYIPSARLTEAATALCSEWLAYARARGIDEQRPEDLAAVVQSKPQAFLPLCNLGVDVDLAINATAYRFVTRAERSRYRRDHCRLALDYLVPDSIAIDRARLAADHPTLYAPLCASVIQNDVGAAALTSNSRREVQTITRRSCVEALESGVIRCGQAGFSDAQVDENRLDAILTRQGL